MSKIKVAIVGVGSISETHLKAYSATQDFEVYAFCDINKDRLAYMGEKYGVTRLYTDEAEMLAALPEIEAVDVCTWNAAHAPCSIMALEAGKHVFCEKPMALNAKEAEEMKAAAEKAGKVLMIGFVRRFGNDTAVTRDFINAGNLGDIYYAKATYLRRNGYPGGWFGNKEYSGGGPLIDLGVHVIDLCRYLMGCPKPVSAYGATFDCIGMRKNLKDSVGYRSSSLVEEKFNVEDMATALVRFDNGAVLSVEASFNLHIKNNVGEIQLFGSKGGVSLDPEFSLYTEVNNYLADVTLNMPTALSFDGLFQNEINYFVESLLTDRDLSSIAEDGHTLMKILDAIYESAATGKECRID